MPAAMLTTRQVAERLGLACSTVSQHAKHGRIPGATDVSIGRNPTSTRRRAVWRFDADLLEAWIASRTTGDTWRKPKGARS